MIQQVFEFDRHFLDELEARIVALNKKNDGCKTHLDTKLDEHSEDALVVDEMTCGGGIAKLEQTGEKRRGAKAIVERFSLTHVLLVTKDPLDEGEWTGTMLARQRELRFTVTGQISFASAQKVAAELGDVAMPECGECRNVLRITSISPPDYWVALWEAATPLSRRGKRFQNRHDLPDPPLLNKIAQYDPLP